MLYREKRFWLTDVRVHASPYGAVPFFCHLDYRSKIAICDKLLFRIYERFDPSAQRVGLPAAGEPITVEGQRGGDMYIIMKGQVQVVQGHKLLGKLHQHNFFGEYCLLLPPSITSYGQLHRRTHYALGDPSAADSGKGSDHTEIASLGYEGIVIKHLRLL